ncbi:MAG: YbbR-like domain-containing protein [Candidatus Cloacimonetes bacterium]|nr:YbbR-like domain-containing protein [Candidatus Cloacimonadota bacterium]
MFRENNGLRIVALVLAAMIWLQSVLVSEQRSVVSLPINLLYVPQNITLEDIPESIPFSVKGKGQDILKMMLFKPKVNIDASKITQYSDILTLEDYSIDLPDNVNVTFLGPAQSDRIAIQADVFHQKVVPVVLDFSDDNSRERIRELNYTLDPDKLTIFGPKTRIKNIKSVRTKPISASDLAESQSKLELKLPEGDVSVSESSVLLTISGVQEETRVFPNIVLPGKYLPSMVAVKVRGEAAVLDRLNEADIKASVAENTGEGAMLAVQISLPEGVELVAITPDKVRPRK